MKKLGFGCMRLPMNGKEVDYKQFSKMIDRFIEEGFTYFDTAHGYLDGKSEIVLRECLVKRYPRTAYTITDKLTENYFNSEDDIRNIFQTELDACGVDYFDYFLLHAMTAEYYPKYVRCNAFEVVKELKKQGRIKHIGMSFHDKADVLERILKEQPDVEMVQLQFNYIDFDDPSIESHRCYQVCEKYNKPVIVMEPVKGGGLINLPDEAKKIFDDLDNGSYASYAIRFCASFPNISMVLSGMSTMEQLEDNVSYMKDFVPFGDEEYKAVERVREILKHQDIIPCTACRYCTAGCPQNISIPDLFSCYNAKKQYKDWNSDFYYGVHTSDKGKASDCIKCGKCEYVCPQHLKIRDLLKEVAAVFDHEN